jgi:MerR HTH family regulatory protein
LSKQSEKLDVNRRWPAHRVEGVARQGRKAKELGDLEGHLPRPQAATLLGVSMSTLKWWHKKGVLVPALQKSGVFLYTRAQLEEFRDAEPERMAARAFKLFEEGATPVRVVIELEASPTLIETMHELYVRLSGAWRIAGPSGARSAWERAYGLGELTPTKLRRALELCASHPELKAKLLEADG